MEKFILLVSLLGAVRGSGIAGDTYSCFSHFEQSESDSCLGKESLGNGKYELSANPKSGTAFCVDAPLYGKSRQGTYEKAKNYIVSAELQSSFIEKYSNRYGFVGLAFNMEDAKNYDIAYVRPHTMDHCWETGHVEDGVFYGKAFGACEVKLDSEFSLAIKMEKGKATLYLNGVNKVEFNSFFPSVNRIGTVLRNNMEAKMVSKDLLVCYEVDCVSSVEGEIVITKPLQEYRTAEMKACQSASCGLYGQMQNGCKSLEQQGVSCTAPAIAAIDRETCCARCVPPAATCSASGDPHYNTLDGRAFDFMGSCTYCYVKTPDFEVRQKNYKAGSVSITEYVLFLFDGDTYKMDGRLSMTDASGAARSINIPWKKMYAANDWVECNSLSQCKIFVAGVQAAVVKGGSGWISVDVHGTYFERTSCLCGKWDGDRSNDFTNRAGVVTDVYSFAHSWVVNNDADGCPKPPEPVDPCKTRQQTNYAEQFCAKFKQMPFKSCPLDVTQYVKDCEFDICTDPKDLDNICSNAKSYADACNAAGYPVDGWRTSTFCPMECEESFVFDSCGGDCYPTCDNPDPECSATCVEGCYCPTGTVLQAGKCVDASECKCTFEGDLKETGEIWLLNATCQECECMEGGVVDCGPRTCDDCPAGEVPIVVEGKCCPSCHADWASSMIANLTCMEGKGPTVFTCQLTDGVLVRPEQITWTEEVTGEVLDTDNMPAGFSFDNSGLVLTLDPCETEHRGHYKASVSYKGVIGTCDFNLNVIDKPTVKFIELVGDSPKVVKEGDCVTLSVSLIATDINFSAADFSWKFGPADTTVDVTDARITMSNGGKTIKICNAVDEDEGKYTICATHPTETNQGYPIMDCVDIEVVVLVVCELDDGSTLTEGQNKTIGCATCTCEVTGEALCECDEQDKACDEGFERYFDEECCAQCSRLPAVCSVTGDPHYMSFDGHRHDFQGACKFTMISTADYKVNVRNEHRGQKNVSWTREVEIVYKGVTLLLGPEGVVTSGGNALQLPYVRDWRSGQSLSIKKAGEKVIASIKLTGTMEALYLEWDGNSTSTATVHGKYYDGTNGLCGTWNDDEADDQTKRGGAQDDDLAQFGYSWKIVENGEVCEEAPLPPHPCDDTWAADAAPIADAACDILDSAPFAECHALVDVETAKYNCKYDVCSCYDSDCGCSAIKQYVQSCLDAGVTSVEKWREVATFCPLTCHSPYAYFICGSNCPASCADREPDCGRGSGKCNEGCFCPVGTFEQNSTCVSTDECACLYNGETKEEGDIWYNEGTCKDCTCGAAGEISCLVRKCGKCGKKQLPVRQDPSDCCNTCVDDWLSAATPALEELVIGTEQVIECVSFLPPNNVIWEHSGDSGATWTQIDAGGTKKLRLIIASVVESDAGQYRCTCKKNYRTASAITTVTVAEPAASCTSVASANGAVTPEGEVLIGGLAEYECFEGYYLDGEGQAVCQGDGILSSNPVCVEKEKVSVITAFKYRGTSLTLNCKVADKTFKKGHVAFWELKDDGTWSKLPGNPKYVSKTGNYSLVKKGATATAQYKCLGEKDTKLVSAVITATKPLKKGRKG